MALRPAEKLLAGALRVHTPQGRHMMLEAGIQYGTMMASVTDAITMAAKSFRLGQPLLDPGRARIEGRIRRPPSEAFNVQNPVLGQVLDALGTAVGARYVVEYNGKPADPKKAFRKLADEVLGQDAAGVVRHTLRHTSATWLMQDGVDMWEASGYLGMTRETLEKTYGHHHPDHQSGVGDAFTRGTAGRKRK